MRLYFARHGESEANLLRVISNRGRVHPLTEKGIRQAEALGSRLAEDPAMRNIQRIYTSPLLRAVQTAEILGKTLNLPVAETDALREFDCGEIEGRSDEAAWARHSQVREDWHLRGLADSRIEGGESLNDIRARFLPLIQGLVERQEDAVLVGHGGTYITVLSDVLVNVERAFVTTQPMENTSYVLAELREGRLVCLAWCGVRLLF